MKTILFLKLCFKDLRNVAVVITINLFVRGLILALQPYIETVEKHVKKLATSWRLKAQVSAVIPCQQAIIGCEDVTCTRVNVQHKKPF